MFGHVFYFFYIYDLLQLNVMKWKMKIKLTATVDGGEMSEHVSVIYLFLLEVNLSSEDGV